MTAAPEKAAPIPADVLVLAEALSDHVQTMGYRLKDDNRYSISSADTHRLVDVARHLKAALADREARPSLPDSREERIRAEAAEDERDRLLVATHWQNIAAWLQSEGAMHPAARARARQGGSNG